MQTTIAFDNTYGRLPARFHARVEPARVERPALVAFNGVLADELGLSLDPADAQTVEVLAGNRVPDGAEPLAMAYAGHQFGHFVPQLGDGRAILLGEVVDRRGRRRDIQLKGAGRTPYSRGGDGRAPLGPVLREYLLSEAMHALGVPTTRALAAVTTGETVFREYGLPGAVLTRVAASHVRVGTFQYLAARGDTDGLTRLADHVIARHYPDAAAADAPYRALLDAVVERQAALIAHWMRLGFVHGVMNTDNMTVSGETIDYGPCAFMDAHQPTRAFSSIDRGNRYAYANQPVIAQWNLARFAETLLPLLDTDESRAIAQAEEALAAYADRFNAHWLAAMGAKLGLAAPDDGDRPLIADLLDLMESAQADFTLTFRLLCDAADANGTGKGSGEGAGDLPGDLPGDPAAWQRWAARWRERLQRDGRDAAARAQAMRAVNPYVIPRNHRVEQAIRAAEDEGDFGTFRALLEATAEPCNDAPHRRAWAAAPQAGERVHRTFCGT